ncbi:hypothetical protein HK100_000354 [Physocladia obscura]|uniref:Transcription initiation factor IIF subunit beta n=1 Tax=Physocladia obscura TaxID=109957 RepID=A0AAD5TAF0_9FUNG|nr:hypothetical protein HK100_000354 [Physocladia obscura]
MEVESNLSNGTAYDANQQWIAPTPPAIVAQQTRNATTPVDARALPTQAWLVKIPKFVKEKWDLVGSATPGVDLGVLRVYNQPAGSKFVLSPQIIGCFKKKSTSSSQKTPKITLHLPSDASWVGDLPKDYNLSLTNQTTQNTYVMTTNDAQDTPIGFTASVVHEATVYPVPGTDHRRLTKLRNEEESKKRKNIIPLGFETSRRAHRIQSSMGGDIAGSIIRPSQSALNMTTARFSQLDKKERLPRAELTGDYYSFKTLQEKTLQPAVWLKEVLTDVAQLVKKGIYSSLYELKPELKQIGENGNAEFLKKEES